MFTGVAESIILCRQCKARQDLQEAQTGQDDDLESVLERLRIDMEREERVISRINLWMNNEKQSERFQEPMKDPSRFVRKKRAHRNQSLLPSNGNDCVIAPWSTGGGVDEEVDHIICDPSRWRLGEHDVHIHGAKDLLERVEGEPTQFTFDEVWPVLHDGFELDVPVPRLPARNEVEHVGAVSRLAFFSALCAGEGDAEHAEKGQIGDFVPHAEEAGIKVDFGEEGRDGDEGGVSDDQKGGDSLVEESRVHVCCLLQDDDVAACGGKVN